MKILMKWEKNNKFTIRNKWLFVKKFSFYEYVKNVYENINILMK